MMEKWVENNSYMIRQCLKYLFYAKFDDFKQMRKPQLNIEISFHAKQVETKASHHIYLLVRLTLGNQLLTRTMITGS